MLNVLNLALPVINSIVDDHAFEFRRYLGDDISEFGTSIPLYSDWEKGDGSVQPQEVGMMDVGGLDAGKRSITIWSNMDFRVLDEQAHCDQVRFNGRVYNCERRTKWLGANGWSTFLCTEDRYPEGNSVETEEGSDVG